MRTLWLSELEFLRAATRRLEAKIPPPTEVLLHGRPVLRYREALPQQALFLKLARQVSGLHALDILWINGFVQEQAVIQRTLDEMNDQIAFLAAGLIFSDWTELHIKFCDYFWQEEFDAPSAIGSSQKRGMISNEKIRSYIFRTFGVPDPSTAEAAGRTIYKTYSGYVHAAAPQLMDMFVGEPPRICLAGMRGTQRQIEHGQDAMNYFYRGLIGCNFVAKALGDEEIARGVYIRIKQFEANHGVHVLPINARPEMRREHR